MVNSLIKAIQEMKANNDELVVMVNYPTSVSSSNGSSMTSNPRVILKTISDKYDDILVGKTSNDRQVIINPSQIVYVQPYVGSARVV